MAFVKSVNRACAVAVAAGAAVLAMGNAPPPTASPPPTAPGSSGAAKAAPAEKLAAKAAVPLLPPADSEWEERSNRYGGDEWVTRPSRDAVLGFTLAVEIQEILVKPGHAVKQSQRLIRARDGEVIAGLEVQRFKSTNDTEVRNAQAALELAKSRFEAIDKVMTKDAGTKAEHDERRLNYASALIGVEAAQMRLREEVLRLTQADEQAKRYAIEAPFDGIVDQLVAEIGQAVTEQDPIIRVVDVDPLWIDVPVKTDVTIREKLGLDHEAWALLDVPGEPIILKGKVLYVSAVADAASGTRRVRVEMNNPDLWPAGTRARVRFAQPSSDWLAYIRGDKPAVAIAPEGEAAAKTGGKQK